MSELKLVKLRPLAGRGGMFAMVIALCIVFLPFLSSPSYAADKDWDSYADQMIEKIEQIPDQYAAEDISGVETSIRQAYYEIYQVSGMEAEIDHRLGEDRSDAFVSQLLSLRDLSQNGVSQEEIEAATSETIELLQTNVADLKDAPEINDKWSRVATRSIDQVEAAKTAYAAGDYSTAANAARDAYLAHYEADGLEKATISYIGQSRVSEVESMFTQLRQTGRDGEISVDEFNAKADELISALTEDATELDALTSSGELGWTGFWASFAILLREGAEALLVVAAVVTYAMKAGRKDQLVGILVGVGGALAISIGLAFAFSKITSSAATGFGQEVIEGVTGLLAVVMLIWVSNWILSKSSGNKWQKYIEHTAGEGTSSGGVFALASVAFLAVLREGAETILFFSPIIAASKTGADHAKMWLGIGAAVIILAIMFILIWVFGVRLPMKAFFKWTSVLLGILAVTIAGGAVKEFQDATLVHATAVGGVPEVSWLGLYPTVETLAAQGFVIIILVILAVIQRRSANQSRQQATQDDPAVTHTK
ncbi:MAG: FTR1 family iron permease [Ancrocorticia populi]|uniref:FTR1 family iron permease n=1 Tax=Ancrocorticia populi TaxID=2175228 RepID=UPI002710AF59|nr:FTR1 family iron permease [Ancrocorticia sp.]